jgi:hypothetical protein
MRQAARTGMAAITSIDAHRCVEHWGALTALRGILFVALSAGVLWPPSMLGVEPRIDWFDPSALPTPIAANLTKFRALACGPVDSGALPVPIDAKARLVFISCHGGPHPCADRFAAHVVDGDTERLGCPADVGVAQLATAHVIYAMSPEKLAKQLMDGLTDILGADGVRHIPAEDGGTIVVELQKQHDSGTPWSPKRLHVAISPTRQAFAAAGYGAQARYSLSYRPPNERSPSLRCTRTLSVFTPRSVFSDLRTEPFGSNAGVGTDGCYP